MERQGLSSGGEIICVTTSCDILARLLSGVDACGGARGSDNEIKPGAISCSDALESDGCSCNSCFESPSVETASKNCGSCRFGIGCAARNEEAAERTSGKRGGTGGIERAHGFGNGDGLAIMSGMPAHGSKVPSALVLDSASELKSGDVPSLSLLRATFTIAIAAAKV